MDYFGDSCNNKNCKNNCLSNLDRGLCNFNTGKCICSRGYFGDDCSLISCKNDCNNRGKCDEKFGVCLCEKEYKGEACEVSIDN